MVTRDEWIAAVRSHIGIKVHHRGYSKQTGVDCSGLLISAWNSLGLPEIARPYMNGGLPDEDEISNAMSQFATQVDELLVGYVAQVRWGKKARHLVLYSGDNECSQRLFVHAQGKRARVVETTEPFIVWKVWKPKEIVF